MGSCPQGSPPPAARDLIDPRDAALKALLQEDDPRCLTPRGPHRTSRPEDASRLFFLPQTRKVSPPAVSTRPP